MSHVKINNYLKLDFKRLFYDPSHGSIEFLKLKNNIFSFQ